MLDKRSHLSRSKPLVLIVEPQEDFRNVLKMRLLNEGFQVKPVGNAAKGLEVILKHAPDLIIADADAERSESFDLLRELREDSNLCT